VRARVLVGVTAAVLGTASSTGADVSVAGNRVSIDVRAMPASAVLDRIGRATGMKVSYEGGQPRTLVTIQRLNVSPQDAVLAVMEGLGVSYALIMDQAGQKVDSLVVLGGPVRPGAAGSSPAGARPRNVPAPAPMPSEPDEVPQDIVGDPMDEMDTEEHPVLENPEDEEKEAETSADAPATSTITAPTGPQPIVQPTPLPWPPAPSPVQPVPPNRRATTPTNEREQ
jgi:hypothetical protein